MGSDKLLAELPFELDPASERAQGLTSRRKAIFLERYLPGVHAFAHARQLVETFKGRGLRCIVASAASAEELDPLLAIADVGDLFDHVVRPDEVEGSKPDPDIIAGALRWSGDGPEAAVMIGDTRFDIGAAHTAGVPCIALRSGGAPAGDLSEANATFDSPEALVQALTNSTIDELVGAALHAGKKASV